MRTIILFSILVFMSVKALAQPDNEEKLKRLQDQKIEFFTNRLDLTKNESREFWPVYNDYQNRKNLLAQERKNTAKYFTENSENISEDEAGVILKKYIDYQKKETSLLEIYTNKFRDILPEKKVIQVFLLEVQFKQWLLKMHMKPRPNVR